MFFSELIKRELSKLMIVVFLYTSIAPSFAMQGQPEYVINVERCNQNDTTEVSNKAFSIVVQRLVTEQAVKGAFETTAALAAYQTVFSQVVAPFMMATAYVADQTARLYEVLQNVKATVESAALLESSAKIERQTHQEETEAKSEVETQLSHGFCLSIPELGELLISHDGDVVFDSEKSIGKSLKILAPSQVILNNTTAQDIDIKAAAAILVGKTKSKINSLRFTSDGDLKSPANGLFIDKGSELEVKELSLEDALLINSGHLTVTESMDLNGGYFLNTGQLSTSANPTILKNIAYLQNTACGRIEASENLVLGATHIANLGNISAKKMQITTSEILDNRGTIETENSLLINGFGNVINNGKIDGKAGVVAISGDKFEHKSGEIKAARMGFGLLETLLFAPMVGQEVLFRNKVTNSGSLNFQRGVVDGLFVNSSADAKFEKRLELSGQNAEIKNSGKITTYEIMSEAESGVFSGGETTAASICSSKHLEFESTSRNLKAVKTSKTGILRVNEYAVAPNLTMIDNAGTTQLSTIEALPGITNISKNTGTLIVATSLPNLTDLNIPQASKFLATEKSNLPGLKNIRNNGFATLKTQLMNLDSVRNGQGAEIRLLAKTIVKGGGFSKQDVLSLAANYEASENIIADVIADEIERINTKKTQITCNDIVLNLAPRANFGQGAVSSELLDIVYGTIQGRISKPFVELIDILTKYIESQPVDLKNKLTAEALKVIGGSSFSPDDVQKIAIRSAVRQLKNNQNLKIERVVTNTIKQLQLSCFGTNFNLSISQECVTNIINTLSKLGGKSLFDEIALQNDGKIVVRNSGTKSESEDSDLIVNGTYKASKDAVLKLEGGVHVVCSDYANDGVILSSNKLKILQNGTATKWGKAIAKDAITYEIPKQPSNNFDLAKMTLEPIIANRSGEFIIDAKDVNFNVSKSVKFDNNIKIIGASFNNARGAVYEAVDFNGTFGTFTNYGEIKVNKFDVTSTNFSITQGSIRSKTGVTINTTSFKCGQQGTTPINTVTRPDTYRLQMVGSFYDSTSVMVYPMIEGFPSDDPVNQRTEIFYPYKPGIGYYSCELVKDLGDSTIGSFYNRAQDAGYIATGGALTINANSYLSNDFGYLYAKDAIMLSSPTISNEGGVIYSKSKARIIGGSLNNGAVIKESYDSYYETPIKEYKVVKRVQEFYGKRGTRHGAFGGRRREVTGYNWNETKDQVITSYKPKTEEVFSSNPGFIYVENTNGPGDIELGLTDINFGDIMASGNIRQLYGYSYRNGGYARVMASQNVSFYLNTLQFLNAVIAGANVEIRVHDDIKMDGYYEKPETAQPFIVRFADFMPQNSAIFEKVTDTARAYTFIPSFNPERVLTTLDPKVTIQNFKGSIIASPTNMPKPNVEVRVTVDPELLESFARMTAGIHLGRNGFMQNSLVAYLQDKAQTYLRNITVTDITSLLNAKTTMLCYEPLGDADEEANVIDAADGISVVKRGFMRWLNPALVVFPEEMKESIYADNTLVLKGDQSAEFDGKFQDAFNAKSLELEARNKMLIGKAQTVFNEPVEIPVINKFQELKISGDMGTTVFADVVASQKVQLESQYGNVDFSARKSQQQKETYTNVGKSSEKTETIYQPSIKSRNVVMLAPVGKVTNVGVNIECDHFYVQGKQGYTAQSAKAVRDMEIQKQSRRKSMHVTLHQEIPVPTQVHAKESITIVSDNATIAGAEFVTKNFTDDTQRLSFLGEKATTIATSHQKKSNFWGYSESQTYDMVETPQLAKLYCDTFKSKQKGTLAIQSLAAQIGTLITQKDIESSSMTCQEVHQSHSVSGGLFAPKLKGDPIIEAVRECERAHQPAPIVRLAATAVQTDSHIATLTHLQQFKDPVTAALGIFASRYVVGPMIRHSETTSYMRREIPIPSQIEIGTLEVENDRSVIQGNWNVGTASIKTKEFRVLAQESRLEQHTETEGFGVMFGFTPFMPLLMCNPSMGIATGLLPTISIQKSTSEQLGTTVVPTRFTANQLVLRAGNVVYSGGQVRARLVDAVINGDFTMASMKASFTERTRNTEFNTSVHALFNAISSSNTGLISSMAAVPGIRLAKREVVEEKLDTLAAFVGEQKFYLKVGGDLVKRSAEIGLVPDGMIVKNEMTREEHIEAKRILEEKIELTNKTSKTTFDTNLISAIGELKSNVDEFNELKNRFIVQKLEEGATMKEAREEAAALEQVLEQKEVKESYEKLKVSEKKLQAAAEKIAKLEAARDQQIAEPKLQQQKPQQPELGKFIQTSYQTVEMENAVKEYNSIARTCLIGLTNMREYLQNLAQQHPQLAKYAEYAMDGIAVIVPIGSYAKLFSRVVKTAACAESISGAIIGAGWEIGKKEGMKPIFKAGQEKLIELAGNQGANDLESQKFAETVEWIIGKAQNARKIYKFSKLAADPLKPYYDTKTALTDVKKLVSTGRVATEIDKSSKAWSQDQKANMLKDVISKLGDQ